MNMKLKIRIRPKIGVKSKTGMNSKISIYTLITYLLFVAVFKPYFLPDVIRVTIKVCVLVFVFLFLLVKVPVKELFNYALVFGGVVLLSCIAATFRGNYGVRNILDSILYFLTFYDLYTFAQLCYKKGKAAIFRNALYQINLVYCVLTIISIMLNGVQNNSNQAAYLFGNKFVSMYLFILLISLYGSTHDMERYHNQVLMFGLFVVSIAISLYVGCATVTVTLVFLLVFLLIPASIQNKLVRPSIMVVLLIMSAVILIWIELILKIDFISRIVSDFFHKSYTVTGRLEIYGVYIWGMIKRHFWFGYGYSNSIMMSYTNLYANAQNGVLEFFMTFGFVGVVALFCMVYHCYKYGHKNGNTTYIALTTLAMIIAGIFEVTINWFFLLSLCLIRWNSNDIGFKYERKVNLNVK